jgi:hypothetical protein
MFALALAIRLPVFDSVYYLSAFMSADVSDVLVKHPTPLNDSPP